MTNKIKKMIKYVIGLLILKMFPLKSNILTIDETIDFISKRGNSMVRFGDGEFSLMEGKDIDEYQKHSNNLSYLLNNTIENSDNKKLLVCLPEPIKGVSDYVKSSKIHWTAHIAQNYFRYKKICNRNIIYGNSFISRPYMIYKNKEKSKEWFTRIIDIWNGEEVLLVEGEYSRSGVGNDLFSNVKKIERIICPGQNAFDYYDDILNSIEQFDKKTLILLALGPTSKPIAKSLSDKGYWTLDIGHLDSEYEWYKSNATSKIKLNNKHSAEIVDANISSCTDEDYLSSIRLKIGIDKIGEQ